MAGIQNELLYLALLLALIVGPELGETIAVKASEIIMPFFIRPASLSIFSGLIYIYIRGEHALAMKD